MDATQPTSKAHDDLEAKLPLVVPDFVHGRDALALLDSAIDSANLV